MHLASSASNFKWELKNTFSFWYFFLSVQLKSFLLTCRKKKKSNNKEKHPNLPYSYYTTKGGGGTTLPPISKAGKETQTVWV